MTDAEYDILRAGLREARLQLAERDRRLEEFERRDTERPTEKTVLFAEVVSELVENRRAIGAMCSTVETTGRMATEVSRVISEDLHGIVQAAVRVAVGELLSRVEELESQVRSLQQWKAAREIACEGCAHLNASGM
jgi:hypothetical protein